MVNKYCKEKYGFTGILYLNALIRPKHSDPDPQPLTETWQTCRNQGVGTKAASVYFALLGKRVRGSGVNQWRRDFLYLAIFWL